MRSRRVAVVAVGAALATAAAVVLHNAGPASGGPLSGTPAYGYGVVMDVGGDITDAFNVLTLAEDGTAQLELVRVEQVYA